MAVEEVSRQVELVADQKKADLRVLPAHGLEDDGRRLLTIPDQSGAALARAEGVGIGVDLLVPEHEEDAAIIERAGEIVAQVIVGAAIERDLVPALAVAAVGAADHAVVGDGLGIADGILQLRLQLQKGKLCGVVQFLPRRALIALAQQEAEHRDQQQDRRKPAEDDDRGHPRPQRDLRFPHAPHLLKNAC